MAAEREDEDNEYLREYRAQRDRADVVGDFNARLQKPGRVGFFERRVAGVRRYAFAVPNRAALDAIARYSPIVELGAGTGYWAYLLLARRVDIVAYDLAPPGEADNAYRFEPRTWTKVQPGGVEILDQYAERALFLCWPGYRDTFAADALARYAGRRLIYIGEGPGGNTASDAFFDRLRCEWSSHEQISIPQWPGAHDCLRIYYRQRAS